jgi:integrase
MAVRKEPDRGYVVDFYFEPANGRRKRVRKKAPVQTKRGAEAYERQLRDSMLQKETEEKEEVPTMKTFSKEFTEIYVKNNNKPSVQADKRSILDNHILPALRNRRLDEIGVRDVERIKRRLLDKGRSPKTVNNVLSVLSKLLDYAVEVELIEQKPRISLLRVAPSKRDFLDFDEYERLVAVLKTEPLWGTAILAAGDGGFRLGEILGMYREDIDHVAGTITIRRALWHSHLGSPKGGRERKLPMTRRLRHALKADRHLKGPFMWCDSSGVHLTKKMAQRAIERVCKRAGLRKIGWHVLRHTFCSHLAMRGAAPKAIQELAGHSDITTTMIYMHLTPTALNEAVSLLDQGHGAEPGGHHMVTR